MKLTVLASGSHANCYVLHSHFEALIIEAGVNVKQVLETLDFNITKVAGCLISHSHADHSKHARNIMTKGITCYSSSETFHSLNLGVLAYRAKIILPKKSYMIGNFKVMPFDLRHDVPCLGFIIQHNETGNIFFATDTKIIPYKFTGINHFMIESNYQQSILDYNVENGIIPNILRGRVIHSHLEFENAKSYLLANDLKDVHNIILLHLSGQNANGFSMRKEIMSSTGKNVFIAKKGLEIELNKEVF